VCWCTAAALSWRLGAREVAQMLQHNWIAPLHRVPCQPHPHVATNEVPAERPTAMIPFLCHIRKQVHYIWALFIQLGWRPATLDTMTRLNTTLSPLLYHHPPNCVHADVPLWCQRRVNQFTGPSTGCSWHTPGLRLPRRRCRLLHLLCAVRVVPDTGLPTVRLSQSKSNIRSTGGQQGPRGGTSETGNMHMYLLIKTGQDWC
jgi:hypothetical protein